MAWLRSLAGSADRNRAGRGPSSRAWRQVGRRIRCAAAVVMAPVLGAGTSLTAGTAVVAGAAALTVVSTVAVAAPAQAATSKSVLILGSSVNGGTSSAEYQQAATTLGYSVTVDSDTQWGSTPTTGSGGFSSYSAIIIGDPSTTTCSTTVPSEALSTVGTWEPAVTGNVAILGTAPALAGTAGAKALIAAAIAHAASGSGTGLYVSLNCEDSGDSAGTSVGGTGSAQNWLNGVEGIGTTGGLTDTGEASTCPAGAVNAQEAAAAAAATAFTGLGSGTLAGWPSPACGGQETFNSWPAWFTPLAYVGAGSLAGGSSSADFTASDGAQGQPLVLLGTPVTGGPSGTAGLAPSVNGEVPPGTAVGGSNPAAPGVSQGAAGDPVNTENGDFTQSNTDLSIPGFGPPLQFSRTYDAQMAQQQAVAGTPVPAGSPGSLGYGWTDNWDTWLSAGRTVPGYAYTIDGLGTDTGNGGPATLAAMNSPASVIARNGNVYVADTAGNRIEEIPGASGTQWGISMTAGNMYTILGSDAGQKASGGCQNGTAMASCLLNGPVGVAVDSAGDLFVADTGDNRVIEVAVANGTNYGIPMTAGDVYTVAGNWGGSSGHSGDGGPASQAFLIQPTQVAFGASGDTSLYIADAGNNRVQEVFQTGGEQWNQSPMTSNDIYTVAGQASGTDGNAGGGGPANQATLSDPQSVSLSSGGDLYIAVTGDGTCSPNCGNKIQEVPESSGTQWNNISMTANDIYTVAGDSHGSSGISPNNTVDTSTLLDQPTGIFVDNGTQMYITDAGNHRVAEIARTPHMEWGISMTVNDLYDIAGSATGTAGYSGNGGPATSAKMSPNGAFGTGQYMISGSVGYSSAGMYVADTSNNEVRLVSSSSPYDITDFAGGAGSFAQDGDGGTAVNGGLFDPYGVATDSHGDIFIADTFANRVQEIAAWKHTQFGISMQPGDVYTVAGSPGGYGGISGDGGAATSALLLQPTSVAVDGSGNLYIADSINNRVQEVSASTASISTFAGSATGTSGNSGQGGLATKAFLNVPYAVAADPAGDVFITCSNQVLEVPATTGTHYGISMTGGDIYTIAGSTAGTAGFTGSAGPAVSAQLNDPDGLAVDSAGNVYVAENLNNRVDEIAATTHSQYGTKMTAAYFYVIAGSHAAGAGGSGDGGATAAQLHAPGQIALDTAGDLYIADSGNNKIREVAAASGTQWDQTMTGANIYTVAGTGAQGSTTDGVPATSTPLDAPLGITADPAGNLYLTNSVVGSDTFNRLQEITATSNPNFATSPAPGAAWSASGVTITQPGGSQVTFYPQNNGGCVAPYHAAGNGGYCALPQYAAASLSYSSANGGSYSFTPSPGLTYTYGAQGALQSETDNTGVANTVSVGYGTPLPGQQDPQGVSCPATVGTTTITSCDTITAPVGSGQTARTLVLGLSSDSSGNSLVSSVTDPMGRTWTYGYSGDHLTSVTDPLGNVTTYTYDTSNTNPILANDMLKITRPNAQPGGPDAGDATVNTYDTQGRVTSQTDPMGYQTTFSYCVSAATGNCMNSSTGTGYVTVTDPDGNSTVYGYTSGALTSQASWTGAVGAALTSEHDYAPIQAVGVPDAGTQLDAATADGNGNVTQYTYDTAGNPTATKDPLGNTTTQATPAGQSQPACNGTATASSTNNCAQNARPAAGHSRRGDHPAVLRPSARPHLHPARRLRQHAVLDHRGVRARFQYGGILQDHLPAVQEQQRHPARHEHRHQLREQQPAVPVPAVRHHQRRRRRHPACLRRTGRPDLHLHARWQPEQRDGHDHIQLRRRRRADFGDELRTGT